MKSENGRKDSLETTKTFGPPAEGEVVWVDPGPRGVVRLTGPEAVRFCDNFVTAALSKLDVGDATEAFLADARGWVIALVNVVRTADGLLIDADRGPVESPLATTIARHLEHYHIREKVEIVDASMEHAAVLVAGENAAARVEGMHGGAVPCVIRVGWLRREACLLVVPTKEREAVVASLAQAGIRQVSREWLEVARIEAGTPMSVDIPEKTLPQELGRDERAISFTKGCYLGQETVARIDAIGHVNRRLVGLAVEGAVPAVGSAVRWSGETVGTITSACLSPRLGGPLALAIIHAKAIEPKVTALDVEGRRATIVKLPLTDAVAAADSPPTLFVAKRFRVVAVDEPLADGSVRKREVIEHPGSVVILPVLEGADGRRQLVLVENHRVAIGRPLLELPAGTLDRPDEAIAEAAGRELAEETGYRAGRLTSLGGFWMSPGILRERMHLFRAESLVAGSQALEPGERIVVRLVDWDEAVAMCLDGRIDDAKSVTGILLEHARRP